MRQVVGSLGVAAAPNMTRQSLFKAVKARLRGTSHRPPPRAQKVVDCLREGDMLPAIWFILSRSGCDQSALNASLGPPLTNAEEQAAIAAELRDLRCV